jgi:hypothetical protein
MNYIFHKYEGLLVVIVGIPLGTVLLLLCLFLLGGASNRLIDKYNLKERIKGVLITGGVVLCVFISLGSLYLVYQRFVHGAIRYSYLVNRGGEEHLVVWLTRQETRAGVATSYTQRYMSFDIHTGKSLDRIDAVKSAPINDYWIYGPFGTQLWTYCEKSGLLLLDIFKPEVLANSNDILDKNPELRPIIKVSSDRYEEFYDRENHTFSVADARGEIYRVAPDLTIEPAREPASRRHHTHEGSTRILWYWKNMKQDTAKRWEIQGENILIYLDESGRELNRIDLSELFHPDTRPYTLLHRKHESLILVTRDWYTLSAIRTDPETGKVLGIINYFK